MRAFLRIGLLAAAVAVAALAAATHASARAACTPSSSSTSRTFCGPAHATLTVGTKTWKFSGGSCSISGGRWTMNIGTITLKGKPTKKYFGLTLFGTKAGTYTDNAALSWQTHGKSGSMSPSVVKLASSRQSGTFTGKSAIGHVAASGSFSCK